MSQNITTLINDLNTTDERPYAITKQFLKNIVSEIKTIRKKEEETEKWKLPSLSSMFRHVHIAKCETRCRTREEIEKPRKDNKPNEEVIEKVRDAIFAAWARYEEKRGREVQACDE